MRNRLLKSFLLIGMALLLCALAAAPKIPKSTGVVLVCPDDMV